MKTIRPGRADLTPSAEILSIDYEEEGGDDDDESPTAVTWRFKLGQSNSPPFTPSVSNLT
jgi:hypothetical protein